MRDKMAVDIFKELPDAHEFENKDNDANLGAYEGKLTVKSSGMLDDLTISSLESLLCSDLCNISDNIKGKTFLNLFGSAI
ncbi:BnaCnng65870D [Brassica napus]|uniref:(rape) hypothetical protein n=1 Tax=Brassica napus TaxID=3708 RepID=A0A078JQP5_BRANA|nr:unnamed protein product [Brassica napus]CDY69903.1 BnaCnng65870D [Brassica napus]